MSTVALVAAAAASVEAEVRAEATLTSTLTSTSTIRSNQQQQQANSNRNSPHQHNNKLDRDRVLSYSTTPAYPATLVYPATPVYVPPTTKTTTTTTLYWYDGDDDNYDYAYYDDAYSDEFTARPTTMSRNGIHHGNSRPRNTNNAHEAYEYQAVPEEHILDVAVTGGIGARGERSIATIRFNKIPPIIDYEVDAFNHNQFVVVQSNTAWRYAPSKDYIKGVHKLIFPLLPNDYPLRVGAPKTELIIHETMADSVVLPGDFQLHGVDYQDMLPFITPPIYPSNDPLSLFWKDLRTVIQLQIARRKKESPATYNRWPDLWTSKEMTLEQMAKAVQGEYPGSLQQELLTTLFKDGIQMDHQLFPFRSATDFVGTEIAIAAINMWTIQEVSSINFLLKWHWGMPRPEEIVWLIATGDFASTRVGSAGPIPPDIVDSIRSMQLQHATDFTAYEDGCPTHPSYPSMHAAGSVCSIWLPLIVQLTPAQYCEALRVDYAVALARTVAGVHYPQDNYAGMNLGMELMKRALPGHLAEQYGSDPQQVRNKLHYLTQNFQWEDFNPEDCTMNSIPVAERLSYYNHDNDNSGVGIAYNSGSGSGVDSGGIGSSGNDNVNDNSNNSGGLRESVRSPPQQSLPIGINTQNTVPTINSEINSRGINGAESPLISQLQVAAAATTTTTQSSNRASNSNDDDAAAASYHLTLMDIGFLIGGFLIAFVMTGYMIYNRGKVRRRSPNLELESGGGEQQQTTTHYKENVDSVFSDMAFDNFNNYTTTHTKQYNRTEEDDEHSLHTAPDDDDEGYETDETDDSKNDFLVVGPKTTAAATNFAKPFIF